MTAHKTVNNSHVTISDLILFNSTNDECIKWCTENPSCEAVAFDTRTSECLNGPENSINAPVMGNNVKSGWKVGGSTWLLTTFNRSYHWEMKESVRISLSINVSCVDGKIYDPFFVPPSASLLRWF